MSKYEKSLKENQSFKKEELKKKDLGIYTEDDSKFIFNSKILNKKLN